jgi:hypothetical protein
MVLIVIVIVIVIVVLVVVLVLVVLVAAAMAAVSVGDSVRVFVRARDSVRDSGLMYITKIYFICVCLLSV